MNYIVFEDTQTSNLSPFSLNHASFEIRCGVLSNIERVIGCLEPNDKLYAIVRSEIESFIREKYPNIIVNPNIIPSGIMLNGATVWSKSIINNFEVNKSYSSNGLLIAIYRDTSTELSDFKKLLSDSGQITLDIKIMHFNYIWDSIFLFSKVLLNDISNMKGSSNYKIDSSAIVLDSDNIIINDNANIMAGVILDGNSGPIVIDKNVTIDIGALIKGPVYIGENSIINPGSKLRGNVSIGPICKIGGELEDVIIQGYTNKQHDGYLGHSFLGEWINLGANTNNSDLKNNYSNIRMSIAKDLEVNTLKQFLGVMVGDYTRTGISTMLNSGTFIGLGANVFGSGFQPKYIESFRWGIEDKTEFEKFIETCDRMKGRRGKRMSKVEIDLLKYLYNNN